MFKLFYSLIVMLTRRYSALAKWTRGRGLRFRILYF